MNANGRPPADVAVLRAGRLSMLGLFYLCGALSACTTVGPDYARPQTAVQAAWSPLGQPDADAARQLDADWWRQFQDPGLDALIDTALASSPVLQSAAARIEQAQAQLKITAGGALPTVQGVAGSTYSQPDTISQLLGTQEGSTTLKVGVQSSWEIDFWGAVRRGVESDRANLLSSAAAYEAARVSLTASVASTYLSARTLERRIKVASKNLARQAEGLRIATARLRAGATSELDLRQAQTQYGLLEAQLPTLEASLQQTLHALGVLIGRTPDAADAVYGRHAAVQVAVPEALSAGIPKDLLRRRPDVVQAELAAVAQSARIGQSQAALYPSFSLAGSFGLQSSDSRQDSLGDLFSWDSRVMSFGVNLVVPIFDRGRLTAQVEVQDALFKQAVLAYQQQVLKAQQEVEDAFSTIRSSAKARTSLRLAHEGTDRSASLALQRYKAGETDYTTVISAEQAQLQVEDSYATTEGNLLQGYVAAYRALGGGWGGDLAAARPQSDRTTHTSAAGPSTLP